MNASTLLRTSFATLALVAAGVSESNAQQPWNGGYAPTIYPTATAPAFGSRCTIPGYATTVPVVSPPAWGTTGTVSGWMPAVAPRPVLLIDPRLSGYETWAQYDSVYGRDRWRDDVVRDRGYDYGYGLDRFGHRDGLDFR